MNAGSEFFNIPEITVAQLYDTLHLHYETGLSAMIWGQPGVGKSHIVKKWAEDNNFRLTIRMLSQMQPTDFVVPAISDQEDRAKWYLTEWLKDIDGQQPHVLFLDELSAAPQDIQVAGYQLLLDREIGGFKLPDNILVIAAGNRPQDGAVANDMGTAQCDRLTHYQIKVSANEWLEWAIENELHPYVISFINAQKESLHEPHNAVAFPTPRSWEAVSKYLYAMDRLGYSDELKELAETNNLKSSADSVIKSTLAGRIGMDTLAEFLTTIKEVKELYPPEEYVKALHNNPDKLKKMAPESNTSNYGLIFSMVHWAEDIDQYMDAMMVFKFFADKLGSEESNNREEIFTAAVTIIGGQLDKTGNMVKAVTNKSFLNELSPKIREIKSLSKLNQELSELED